MRRNLTDKGVQNAKAQKDGKPKKYSDGGGLFLLVKTSGGDTVKFWRYKYRVLGKEKTFSIGAYPAVSLKEARNAHDDAREQLANGVDPSAYKQHLKSAKEKLQRDSFETVAREWFVGRSATWTENHANRVITRLDNDVFPWLGAVPISTIEPPDILKCLKRVENRGAIETAHRIKQSVGQVFCYAVATGKADRDQTADLKGALPPVKQKHFAKAKRSA